MTDANGVVIQDITYHTDGSATVDLIDENGQLNGTQTLNAAGAVTSLRLYDDAGAEVYFQTYAANGDAGSIFLPGGHELTLTEAAGSLGSTIGNLLGGNSILARVGASTAISTIAKLFASGVESGALSGLATAIGTDGLTGLDKFVTGGFGAANGGNFSIGGTIVDGIGSGLSSILVAEAAHALHLKGIGAVAFNSVAGTVTGTLTTAFVKNAFNALTSGGSQTVTLSAESLFAGVDPTKMIANIETGLAGALGSWVASTIMPARTQGAQIGDQLGSTIGTLAATAITAGAEIGSVVPIIGTFVGALVGALAGTAIGQLIDPFKPLQVSVVMGASGGGFAPLASGAWGSGTQNANAALQAQWLYANAVGAIADVSNQMVALTGATVTGLSGSGQVTFQQVGKNIITTTADVTNPNQGWDWISADGGKQGTIDWARAINEDAMSLLKFGDLVNGDPIMVAALAAASRLDNDVTAVAADMTVAQDYKKYLEKADLINEMIAANPDTAYAAGWIATLARAEELGLNKIADQTGWKARFDVDALGVGRETITDAAGTIKEVAVFKTDGSQRIYQYFNQQTITANFQEIRVADGASVIVNGIGNRIIGANGVNIVANGAFNSIVVDGDDSTLSAYGFGSTITAHGNGDVIAGLGGGASASLNGGANVVSQTGAVAMLPTPWGFYLPIPLVSATTAQQFNAIMASNIAVTIGDNSMVNLNGSGDNITAGSNVLLAINGNANHSILGPASYAIVNGSGNWTSLGNNASANINGDANTTFMGSGSGATISGSGNGTLLGDWSWANIGGNNDWTSLGAHSYVQIDGSGNWTQLGDGSTALINGNYDTTYLGAGSGATVNGVSDGTQLGDWSWAHINGVGDWTSLGSHSNAIINGTGDWTQLGDDSGANINGTNDTTYLGSGSGAVVGGSLNGTTLGNWSWANIIGTGDATRLGSDSYANITGASNQTTLGSGSHADLLSWYNNLIMGLNSSASVTGFYNNVTTGASSSVTIAGGIWNTVDVGAGSSVNLGPWGTLFNNLTQH